MKSHEKVAVSGPGRDEDREMQLKKNPKVHGSRWILPPLSRRDRMILSAWEVVNTPIKLSQTHIIDILPGFQTEAGESLTKTWIGLWITTSLQLSPAPRIPGSTHSSATWTCTVVASQDPCMGETPPGHSGGVWGSSRFKPLKPLSCPLPPTSALASGCPHHGPTQSTLVVPFGCSPCRALAQMSICGSVISMAGKKASASDPTTLDLLTCQAWAKRPARTFWEDRVPPCSTSCCILGLRTPNRWTYMEPGANPPQEGPLLPCLQVLEGGSGDP